MADLYKVIYKTTSGQDWKTAFVSATSLANALAAVKTNDSKHQIDTVQAQATVLHHNIIAGS